MNNLQKWFCFVSKIDFIFKLQIKYTINFPMIKDITMTIFLGSKKLKYTVFSLNALKLIIDKKPLISRAKDSIAYLKLKKNSILSCNVLISSQKDIFDFLQSFIFFVLGKIKEFKRFKLHQKHPLTLSIKDISSFPQLLNIYKKFPNRTNAIININHNLQNIEYSKTMLSSIQLLF